MTNSLLLATCFSLSVAAAADGDLLDRSACTFPVYEKTGRIERYTTRTEYENAWSNVVCSQPVRIDASTDAGQ